MPAVVSPMFGDWPSLNWGFLVCTDLAIRGTLHSVDQYLNCKLHGVSVDDTANFPHMVTRPPLHRLERESSFVLPLSLPPPLSPLKHLLTPSSPSAAIC